MHRPLFTSWRFKYATQKALSLLPFNWGAQTNHWLSVRFGGLREPKFFALSSTLAMVSVLRQCGMGIRDMVMVELGTGWSAASAQMLLALGAREVHSYDLYRHLDSALMSQARGELDELSEHVKKDFPFPCDMEAVAAECEVDRIDYSKLIYHAPHDARATGLAGDSVDCFFSQAVLEHVPKMIIEELLAESFRVLKRGGLCYHYVQPTMHAAWLDTQATGIDFLTCSDLAWRLFYDNSVAHENRLRAPEYIEMLRVSGFEIVGSWSTIDKRALGALATKRVSRRFRKFTLDDLATDYIWILARKP